MDYAGRKVLITGGGGFIGSHLTERLVALGADVRVFLRYNALGAKGWLAAVSPEVAGAIEIIRGDLKDPEAVRHAVAGQQIVFHLGALIAIPYSYQNPTDFFQTNVTGTLHIVNACRQLGVERLVHTSTSEVYGSAQSVPMTEQHPTSAQSPYAASKIGADALVESYFRSFDLPAVILRPFNTFGPRQSERAVIPTIVRQVLYENELRLGATHPTRDFNYVSDTVEGFCLAGLADRLTGEIVHFGGGSETSIAELAEQIIRLTGREIPIRQEQKRLRPVTSEVNRLVCDATRFRRLTGWSPAVSLEDGLTNVIEFYRALPRPTKQSQYAV